MSEASGSEGRPFGLSIVIPCLNGAHCISGQLGALARQGWDGPWEVIVADNGSTDATVEVVMGWADRLPALRVVDASARRGISAARNAGARAARLSAVAWVDADDEVCDGWLAAMGEAARRHVIFAGPLEFVGGEGVVDPSAGRPQPSKWSRWVREPEFLPAAGGGNLGVAKALFDAVGGFDESMVDGAEDTKFCWEVQLLGHELVTVPEAVMLVQVREDLRALARQQYRWGKASVQLYTMFRDRGAPPAQLSGALLRWVMLAAGAPMAMLGDASRRRWIGRLSRRCGRLVASVHYRVQFL